MARVLGILLIMLGLASCASSGEDYVACPEVRLLEGADRIDAAGVLRGEPMRVSLRGVVERCVAGSDGGYAMELDLGLAIRRVADTLDHPEELPIEVVVGFLDSSDKLIDSYVFSEEVFVPTFSSSSSSVFQIRTDVPPATRVVLGLRVAQ